MLTPQNNQAACPTSFVRNILFPTQDINTTPTEYLLEEEDKNIASFFKVGRGRGRPTRKKIISSLNLIKTLMGGGGAEMPPFFKFFVIVGIQMSLSCFRIVRKESIANSN